MRKVARSHFHPKKDPHQIYIQNDVLWIKTPSTKIFWDPNAFRPDPRTDLALNKIHRARVLFGIENLPSGQIVNFPQEIYTIHSKKHFINVR